MNVNMYNIFIYLGWVKTVKLWQGSRIKRHQNREYKLSTSFYSKIAIQQC